MLVYTAWLLVVLCIVVLVIVGVNELDNSHKDNYIDKLVVQHMLQRHVLLQWINVRAKDIGALFLLEWQSSGNEDLDRLEKVLRQEFPLISNESIKCYRDYFAGLMIKNEDSYLPEYFERNIVYRNWSHTSKKQCGVCEIRDEYIYYIRKFLLSVACVKGK